MMNGPGFYKNVGDGLRVQFAQNGVFSPSASLLPANHLTYTYPVDGWTWFDNEDAARTAMGLPSYAVAASALALIASYPDVPIATAIKSSASLIADMPTFMPMSAP